MSYLLEILGRGLIAQLAGAFEAFLGTNSDETTEELLEAAEAEPENLGAQVRLAGRYLRSEDAGTARRILVDVLKRDGKHLPARLGLACALDELGRVEAAVEQLGIAQKADPINPAVLFCQIDQKIHFPRAQKFLS